MPAKTALRVTVASLLLAGLVASAIGNAADNSPGSKMPAPAQEKAVAIAMLDEMTGWLTDTFELPRTASHPGIEFVAPMQLVAMRYKVILPTDGREDLILDPAVTAALHRGVTAVYNDTLRTIFLSNGWTGTTAAEQSILVHELVHHLQNLAREKFNCPEAREKLAYRAQNAWLERSGTNLEREFGLDPMTLLVASRCIH